MPNYVVNNQAQANGDHEVHQVGCNYFPRDYVSLGWHLTCNTAVAAAKRYHPRSNGCKYCSPSCHTS
ncbi:hypothetical protein [Mariniradius saccharolyticus]|uniref:hypothetical protein n=1 Tax=Mariniradius saccharolyticus TaxID=1245591 RepID=UPI0009D9EE76|nr:hypothetical protein [Mariniradius saccharolyticus]